MNEKEMNEIVEKFIGGLTNEQKEKAMSCENMDEFMKLAGEWGLELPDELVTGVAGGEARLMNDGLFKRLKRFLKLA